MRRAIIITLSILTLSIVTAAQDQTDTTQIKLSTDKVKIEGKYYYIHIVRKGETLYSISRAYNVSQVEIAMENPDIYLGLQIDQAIKIPIKATETIDGSKDDKYIYHVVKRKETLFSLTQKYKISLEEIIAINPEVEQGLKTNQVVLIPKSIKPSTNLEAKEADRFIYHEVMPREGFYSLTRKYGVSEATIKRFNADLVVDGLKLGTVLRIPKNANDTLLYEEQRPIAAIGPMDTLPTTVPYIPHMVCDTFVYNRWRDVYNISLLLPFTQTSPTLPSEEQDEDRVSMISEKESMEKNRISPQTANFLDFYQGILLAVDSMKKEGLSINLNVYNTKKSSEEVEKLIRNGSLDNSHLIIGPAYPQCLTPVVNFSAENRIPMVSPLSSNSYLLSLNPFLFQVNPSFNTQMEEFAKQINLCTNHNIVIVHEDDSTNNAMFQTFKTHIDKRISQCEGSIPVFYKEITYRAGSPTADIQERISHSLSLDRNNMVIVPSNNEAFVSDVLGNLNALSTVYKFPIEVYGFPRWIKFRNIQIDYYYQMEIKLFTPFYTDYSRPEVKSFVANYRDAYRAEPSQYAFQGYDVGLYFLTAMKKYGVDFMYCIHNLHMDLLQTDFNFVNKSISSGYENSTIHILNYSKDITITKVESGKAQNSPKPIIYFEEGHNRQESIW